MNREKWTPEQHQLESVLHQMNVDDSIDCHAMTAQQCREVAYASQTTLTLQGKRFISLKTKIGQFVKRIT